MGNNNSSASVRPNKRQNNGDELYVAPMKRRRTDVGRGGGPGGGRGGGRGGTVVDDGGLNLNLSSADVPRGEIRPAPRSLDDCQMSTLVLKAQEACKRATAEVEDKLKEMDELRSSNSNPREAIDTLRSEVEVAVTPFRNTLDDIRMEALQCYNEKCASRDPRELGKDITEECAYILEAITFIRNQLERKCTVFNLRANEVANYYQNIEEMDRQASEKNNFSALGPTRIWSAITSASARYRQ